MTITINFNDKNLTKHMILPKIVIYKIYSSVKISLWTYSCKNASICERKIVDTLQTVVL